MNTKILITGAGSKTGKAKRSPAYRRQQRTTKHPIPMVLGDSDKNVQSVWAGCDNGRRNEASRSAVLQIPAHN
jgi:hypothetical protein